MERLRDSAADLLLGGRCPGCDHPGQGLCRVCRAEVRRGRVRFTARDPSPPGFPLAVAAGEYAGVVRRLISAFKEEALVGLAGELGQRLVLALAQLIAALGRPGSPFCLVPIPSRPAAVRERGLDHTATLARTASRALARRTGLRAPVRPLLRPLAGATDQVGLDAAQRWLNKRDRFAVRSPPKLGLPKTHDTDTCAPVPILVDDVTTTGATLAAAATVLTDAGSPPLGAVVIAATVRRHRPRG